MQQERASSPSGRWIDLEEVSKVSSLARLGLSEEELEGLARQLDQIVAAVAKLSEADVSGVDPTAQVGGLHNICRDDEPRPCLSAEAAIGNASQTSAGLLRVPAIQ